MFRAFQQTSNITVAEWSSGKKRRVTRVYYAQLKPLFASGRVRMRFPHAANMALQTAGKTGGSAGSPSPVGALFEATKWTSTLGACRNRSS